MPGNDRAAAVTQVLRLQTSTKASQSSRPKAQKNWIIMGRNSFPPMILHTERTVQ